jgi:PAS domain S-box-containing protein
MNSIVAFGNTFLTLTLSVMSLALLLVYLPPQGRQLLRVTTAFWPAALGLITLSGLMFAAAPYLWAPLLTVANMSNIGASLVLALIAASWNRRPGRRVSLALGIGFALATAVFEFWRQDGAATFETRVYFVCLARAGFTAWMIAELRQFNRREQSSQIRMLMTFGALYVAANLGRAATMALTGDGIAPNLYAEGPAMFATRIFILATQLLVALSFNNYFVEKLWRQERDASLRHQALFEGSPAAGIIWNDRLQVSGWNDEATRLFGWTRAEALGRGVAELLFRPEEHPVAEQGLKALFEQPAATGAVVHVRTKDGRRIACEWSHRQLPPQGGRPREVVSMALDVSDRLNRQRELESEHRRAVDRLAQLADQVGQSEQSLRELREHLEIAARAVGMGLYLRDFTQEHVWVSDRYREMYGFTADEPLTPEAAQARIHPDDLEGYLAARDVAIKNGENSAEYRIVLPDGRVRWIAAHGRIRTDASGAPILTRAVTIDITDHKNAALELARQQRELAHLSRVVMLGELSGALAHELNQPLTAILSNAQAAQRFLAADPIDLGELRDILDDIVSEDQRAGEVIKRLRQLLSTGETQRAPLDLNELLTDTLRLLRSDLLNQQVTLHTELAPGLPAVWADRVQMQQVLINLIVNGCDAMRELPAAERRLLVRTAARADGSVQVSVVDRGCGLPSERPDRVFESFYTTKPGGMGLGLSVCRTIIQAHGGRLWAEGHDGPGASFHFSLSAHAAPAHEQVRRPVA